MSTPPYNFDGNLYHPLITSTSFPLENQFVVPDQIEDSDSISMNYNLYLQSQGLLPWPYYTPNALPPVLALPASHHNPLHHGASSSTPVERSFSVRPVARNAEEVRVFETGESSNSRSNKDKGKQVVEETSGSANKNVRDESYRRPQPRRDRMRASGVRISNYTGVTSYPGGRYMAFLWDSSDPSQIPRTEYIGGYEDEESAARAHDLAALKLWGTQFPHLNFPICDYVKELEEMQSYPKDDYFQHLRRKSRAIARGASNYRGVSRSRSLDLKKWQSRIWKCGQGYYLGTFDTEEEAARAYDVAAIWLKREAVTNFALHEYDRMRIIQSTQLPIGTEALSYLRSSGSEVRNTDEENPPIEADGSGASAEHPNMQHQQNLYHSYQRELLFPGDHGAMVGGFTDEYSPDEVLQQMREFDNNFQSQFCGLDHAQDSVNTYQLIENDIQNPTFDYQAYPLPVEPMSEGYNAVPAGNGFDFSEEWTSYCLSFSP